jgi:NhaP-type Na+/H+ or K+/H+ antiporter
VPDDLRNRQADSNPYERSDARDLDKIKGQPARGDHRAGHIAAYGSFLAADHFQYSGVIATVAAGLLCGNYGARVGMSPSTRIALETFWEYLAFALNFMVFLLIGLEMHIQTLLASWKAILIAYLVVTAVRALIVFSASMMLRGRRERIPRAWSIILVWGGLRGGLPMVLALSLPGDFPNRDLLISMTFGVVILSILFHGLTMSPLLQWLGITRGQHDRAAYELIRGKIQAARPHWRRSTGCRGRVSRIRKYARGCEKNMRKKFRPAARNWVKYIWKKNNCTPKNCNGPCGICFRWKNAR